MCWQHNNLLIGDCAIIICEVLWGTNNDLVHKACIQVGMSQNNSHVVSWKHAICTTMALLEVLLIIAMAICGHVQLCASYDGPRIVKLSKLSLA
jgi:hypothetical protein